MIEIIKDIRYLSYYAFTATVIATILLVEDIMEEHEDIYEILFDFFTDIPVFALVTLLIGLLATAIIDFLNKKFPWEEAGRKRFVLEIIIMLVVIVIFKVITAYLAKNYFPNRESELDDDMDYHVLALIMYFIAVFMVFSFHEFMILSSDKRYLESCGHRYDDWHKPPEIRIRLRCDG